MSSFLIEIFKSLLVSVTVLLIGKIMSVIVRQLFFPQPKYEITGFWFAEHGSDFNQEAKAIEIYYFSQSGEKIKYKLEQYISLKKAY